LKFPFHPLFFFVALIMHWSKGLIRLIIGVALLGAIMFPLPSVSKDATVNEIAESKPGPPANSANSRASLTLDKVLSNYYKAIGGLASWQSIYTLAIRGKLLSQKREFRTTARYMRPDKCRIEYNIGGKLVVQAYNGDSGWEQNPLSDKPSPKILNPERTNYLKDRCDIESPLIDYAGKNRKVTLEGIEQVDGKAAYKIKVTYPSGNFQYYFIDSAEFLPIKMIGFYAAGGSELAMMTRFGDYRKTGNIVVPFRLAIDKKGGGPHEDYVVDSVTVNPKLDPSIFNMP
jgi:hypothetical protein